MIDEAESFVAAADVLKERGAYKIYVMATHGILSADAPKKIEDSCIDEVSQPVAIWGFFWTPIFIRVNYEKKIDNCFCLF